MKTMLRLLCVIAIGALLAERAAAHVVLQKWGGYAGCQEYATLVVPHGCGPSPTTELRVKIPDGLTILVPEDKPGWQTRVVKRALPTPIAGEGGSRVSEVVDEVIWSGGRLASDRLGLFTMLARMPDAASGTLLYFKTVHKCEQGETRWVDTVPAGEPVWKAWATASTSPFLEVKRAPGPQPGATMQQMRSRPSAQARR